MAADHQAANISPRSRGRGVFDHTALGRLRVRRRCLLRPRPGQPAACIPNIGRSVAIPTLGRAPAPVEAAARWDVYRRDCARPWPTGVGHREGVGRGGKPGRGETYHAAHVEAHGHHAVHPKRGQRRGCVGLFLDVHRNDPVELLAPLTRAPEAGRGTHSEPGAQIWLTADYRVSSPTASVVPSTGPFSSTAPPCPHVSQYH